MSQVPPARGLERLELTYVGSEARGSRGGHTSRASTTGSTAAPAGPCAGHPVHQGGRSDVRDADRGPAGSSSASASCPAAARTLSGRAVPCGLPAARSADASKTSDASGPRAAARASGAAHARVEVAILDGQVRSNAHDGEAATSAVTAPSSCSSAAGAASSTPASAGRLAALEHVADTGIPAAASASTPASTGRPGSAGAAGGWRVSRARKAAENGAGRAIEARRPAETRARVVRRGIAVASDAATSAEARGGGSTDAARATTGSRRP